jgi:hypothetical protein
MTAFTIFTNIWMMGILVGLAGLRWRFPFFRRSKKVAGWTFVTLLVTWIPIGSVLESDVDRAAHEKRKAERVGSYDDVSDHPERYLTMSEAYTGKHGLVEVSGTLTNSSNFALGNARLKCTARAETGKVTNKHSLTIMRVVPPNESVRFGPLAIGVIDAQSLGVGCHLVDAEIVYAGSAAPPS